MSAADLMRPAPPGVTVRFPPQVSGEMLVTQLNRGMYISGALALLLWDVLLTFPSEIRMYRKRGFKWQITPAFLVARYSGPICIGLYVMIVRSPSWTAARCFYGGRASVFLGAIITSAASWIFAVRTWAMWRRNKYILVIVSLLWSGQLAANMVICNWLRPEAWNIGTCVFLMPGHETFWAYYVCNIVYDTIITLLALSSFFVDHHGVRTSFSQQGTMQKVQQRLMADGLIYFAGTLSINLLNAFFFSKLWTYEDINGSLANAITSLCAYRLVLLKLGGDVDLKGVFSSASNPSKASNSFNGGSQQAGSAAIKTQPSPHVTTDGEGVPASFLSTRNNSVTHFYPPPSNPRVDALPCTVQTQVLNVPADHQVPNRPRTELSTEPDLNDREHLRYKSRDEEESIGFESLGKVQ